MRVLRRLESGRYNYGEAVSLAPGDTIQVKLPSGKIVDWNRDEVLTEGYKKLDNEFM